MNKKARRLRRARRTRIIIAQSGATRLTVYRTNGHIYAQVITSNGARVLTSASTLQDFAMEYGGNIMAACKVGKLLAKRALEIGIQRVAFDRAGFAYLGRVKALAEAAREGGLEF